MTAKETNSFLFPGLVEKGFDFYQIQETPETELWDKITVLSFEYVHF